MSWLARILCIVCIVLSPLWSSAQLPVPGNVTSNLRQKTFTIGADSIKVDSISIVPNSFSIANIPPSDYQLDFINAILYWKKKPSLESITITYRVFPFQLNPVAQRMRYDSVMNNFYVKPFEFDKGLSNS
ncbi:MAG: hypothetical protein WAT14_11070, partial [Chitinophagaceae bacterium]